MALVRNTKPRVYRAEGLVFRPGVNEPDDKQLLVAGRNKLFTDRFRTGELQFVDKQSWPDFVASQTAQPEPGPADPGEGGDDGKPEVAALAGMNVADATALIGETADPALLNRWAEQDERVGVQRAITARLDVLDPAKKAETT